MVLSSSFQIDNVRVGSGDLFLIAGPCVIESEDHALRMAEIIKGVTRSLNFPFIFKASYDKANRTSIRSFRGPGVKEGLHILKKIKDEIQLPILTDVHEAADVAKVAEVVDVIQIPALLCRQTDLIVAAALSGRAINIKKGQFVSPWDMRHAVEKCREAGNSQVFLTERGSSFGYGNLVIVSQDSATTTIRFIIKDSTTGGMIVSSTDLGDTNSTNADVAGLTGGQGDAVVVENMHFDVGQ